MAVVKIEKRRSVFHYHGLNFDEDDIVTKRINSSEYDQTMINIIQKKIGAGYRLKECMLRFDKEDDQKDTEIITYNSRLPMF